MKPIVIGILPQERIRARVLAIARGDYKPKPGELRSRYGIVDLEPVRNQVRPIVRSTEFRIVAR